MADAERRFLLGKLIVNVQHRAAGVTEDVFDVFASQRFKQYPRPTHFQKFPSNNFYSRAATPRGALINHQMISMPLACARGSKFKYLLFSFCAENNDCRIVKVNPPAAPVRAHA